MYVPEQQRYRDVRYLAELIDKNRISHILAIPSLYQHLLEFHVTRLRSLATVIVAGEPCPHGLVETHKTNLPQTQLYNEYGPTEATVWSTVFDCSQSYSSASVPIGRPIGNMQVYVLDVLMRQVPPGTPGELCLGGTNISPGYLNHPELTSESFISNCLLEDSAQKFYRTGDLVCFLEDGLLQFIGRNDQQIKIRGYRIELDEIETALKNIPQVSQAVAVPVRAPLPQAQRSESSNGPSGESISALAAFLELQPGQKIDIALVKTSLAQMLPDYMVPNEIIVMDSLPLNPSGKVDRHLLPDPCKIADAHKSAGIEPSDGIEKDIADIWCGVLNLDQVHMADNFFELGGHSLLAVRLFAKIKNRTGLDLPLAMLFDNPTLQELVEHIRYTTNLENPALPKSQRFFPNILRSRGRSENVSKALNQDRWNVVVPIREEGTLPPLFLLHAIFGNVLNYSAMVPYLDKRQSLYALQAVGLDGVSVPFRAFPKMIAHYADELRKVQSQGPYLLAGSSLGGVLALELAQHLHKEGEHILFVGMFDSVIPQLSSGIKVRKGKVKNSSVSSPEIDSKGASSTKTKQGSLPHPGILSRIPVRWPNNRVVSIFTHVVNLSMCIIYRTFGRPRPHDLRQWLMLYSHFTAIKRYRPNTYDVSITFFRSSTAPLDDHPDYGWGKFSKKHVEVIEVAAKHGNEFIESSEFGIALNTHLQELYSRTGLQ